MPLVRHLNIRCRSNKARTAFQKLSFPLPRPPAMQPDPNQTDPTPVQLTIDQALQQAIEHHMGGRPAEAEQLYRAILQALPQHPDANHNLGVLALDADQPEAALILFSAAIESNPHQAQFRISQIDALIKANQLPAARDAFAEGQRMGLCGEAFDQLEQRLRQPGIDETIESAQPAKAAIDELIGQFSAGRFRISMNLAQAMTNDFPFHAFGWKLLGAVLMQTGQGAASIAPMQKAVELMPDDAAAHSNLGVTLKALGRIDEAENSFRRAAELTPVLAEAHYNLGILLDETGRLDEAESCFRRAIACKPGYAEAYDNLGLILRKKGRREDAAACFEQVISLMPDHAEAYSNLGSLLSELGRLDEAVASYRLAVAKRPDHPEELCNLGAILCQQRQFDEAEHCLRQALAMRPDLAEAHCNLGNTLRATGRLDKAEAAYRRAIDLRPDLSEAHCNLGGVLQDLGQSEAAAISCRRAIGIKSDDAEAHYNLGNALLNLGQLGEAEDCFRHAITLKPGYAEAHNSLGSALKDQGHLVEAAVSYRQALALQSDADPADSAFIYSNLLFCLSNSANVHADELFAEHHRFGEKFEAAFRTEHRAHTNSRDPNRPLRIGFVSGDFRHHAVTFFTEPVLTHLSRTTQLSLHAYSNNPFEDDTSARLRKLFSSWELVAGSSDGALAEKIRSDSIDILIDLSGHTAMNRLLTFARKPAPIQASWLGYLGTTGLRAMDYYLADRYFLPVEQFDGKFTEKIVHLPAVAPFLPPAAAPEVGPLPAGKNGHITFGSFNRLVKINPTVVSLWARLMRALPDAKMLIGGMPEHGCDIMLDWFASEGIAAERLQIRRQCSLTDYLAMHRQVDFCLNTFPYGGGATTNLALWMGVPTLMLAGETPTSRFGEAYLRHAGLDGFIADDPEDFVTKGMEWATHTHTLAQVRKNLRSRMEQSAPCKPGFIAENLEQTLRTMWQRWCDGQPPEHLDRSGNQTTGPGSPM